MLEKQLRRQESRTAAQQRDKLAAEKERDAYKHRIGSLESSTAAAWAASYQASQKSTVQQTKDTRSALGSGSSGHVAMVAPGLAPTAAAAAAAKENTHSVVMTLPSPSKLRTASARSHTLGTRSSEGMQPITGSGSASARSATEGGTV